MSSSLSLSLFVDVFILRNTTRNQHSACFVVPVSSILVKDLGVVAALEVSTTVMVDGDLDAIGVRRDVT